eukprot:gb/GEZN01016335.1/.p1 GENE.gb/GEZN01016335.1/~~gb/GEZN01016335.1/.p1  ORF type:complete len:110 (-),score=11.77 gb/GEZN01016335.1/:222-551(-)
MSPRKEGWSRFKHLWLKDQAAWPIWVMCGCGASLVVMIMYRIMAAHPDTDWRGSMRRESGLKKEDYYGQPRLEYASRFYDHPARATSKLERFQPKPVNAEVVAEPNKTA